MDSSTEDKQWATKKYLLDPLNAPEPSAETGPGSRFHRPDETPASPTSKGPRTSISKEPSATVYPSPPTSASPTQTAFHPSNPYSPSHRQTAFAAYPNSGPSRKSLDEPTGNGKGRRRGSSLAERYAGDMSHRPLDQIRKEAKAADRAPHLKKKYLPGADTIDSLDRSSFGIAYHHAGPYDATLLSRNLKPEFSPVEAVRGTNNEALKATPAEHIRDVLDKHVPLQGTAVIPPGMPGLDGKIMDYEEGADLMREPDAAGGAYKRWEGVKYLPEDLKGKGEPSYSVERAIKEHDRAHPNVQGNSYEMQPRRPSAANRQRSASGSNAALGAGTSSSTSNSMRYSDFESGMRRSNTTGKRMGEGVKRTFGTLRKGKKTAEV